MRRYSRGVTCLFVSLVCSVGLSGCGTSDPVDILDPGDGVALQVELKNVHNNWVEVNDQGQVDGTFSIHLLLPGEDRPCCLVALGATRTRTLLAHVKEKFIVRACHQGQSGNSCGQTVCRIRMDEFDWSLVQQHPEDYKLFASFDDRGHPGNGYVIGCFGGWENSSLLDP